MFFFANLLQQRTPEEKTWSKQSTNPIESDAQKPLTFSAAS